MIYIHSFVSYCCSVTKSCLTLCNPISCSKPGFPVLHYLQSLFKLISIESVMLSNHLNLSHSFFLLPSIFPGIRVFSKLLIHYSSFLLHGKYCIDNRDPEGEITIPILRNLVSYLKKDKKKVKYNGWMRKHSWLRGRKMSRIFPRRDQDWHVKTKLASVTKG